MQKLKSEVEEELLTLPSSDNQSKIIDSKTDQSRNNLGFKVSMNSKKI